MENIFEHFKCIKHCSYYRASQENVEPFQISPDFELIELLTKGKIIMDEPGCASDIYLPGTIFWHRCGEWTIHHSAPGNHYECLSIMLEVAKGEERIVPRIGYWNSMLSMNFFVEDALNIYHSNQLPMDFQQFYILGVLLRQMKTTSFYGTHPALEKACELIRQHLDWNFTTEELAVKCYVSKPHLHNLFRNFLHSAPHRYQLEQRIVQARKMLASSDSLSIKEISRLSGFDSIEVFYRHFKKQLGITPNEYRRQQIRQSIESGGI